MSFFPQASQQGTDRAIKSRKNAPLKLGIEKMPVQSIGGLESKNPSNPVHPVNACNTYLGLLLISSVGS